MACYHPLKAIRKRGEKQYKVMCSVQSEHADWNSFIDYTTGEFYEQIQIPCGKCIGCRLEYSRQWANRCVLESLSYPQEQNWFLTLTIDDDHIGKYITSQGFASVHTDDITVFMKALRGRWATQHNVTDGIRFFGCSEYGDESARPHYHILVFGCPMFDLVHYKNNYQGDELFISRELDGVWKKGFVTVAEFNWNTAAYTARYVMKKAKGVCQDYYDRLDIEPEKTRMSRMPGIGLNYFNSHYLEVYDLDEIVLPSNGDQARVIKPPKYFDRKFETIDPLALARLKVDRARIAELRQQAIEQRHGYDPVEFLRIQERSKEKQMQIFSRKILTD